MKIAIAIVLILLAPGVSVFMVPKAASAQTTETFAPSTDSSHDILERRMESMKQMTWRLFWVVTALLLVCVLAFFSLRWVLPRVSKYSGFSLKGDALMKVITRFPLEPRKSVYLIQVGESYHLLGVAEQSVNYLTVLSEKDLGTQLADLKSSAKLPKSFLEIFSAKTKKNNLEGQA